MTLFELKFQVDNRNICTFSFSKKMLQDMANWNKIENRTRVHMFHQFKCTFAAQQWVYELPSTQSINC